MLYAYGKLRKLIEKGYTGDELSPLSGPELIDMLEIGDAADMTTIALLGSDYAAVGATAMRLRRALETVNIPIIIITESTVLLESKKPANPRAIIIEEKSKKLDVLTHIINTYVKWELDESGLEIDSMESEEVISSLEEGVSTEGMPEITDGEESSGSPIKLSSITHDADELAGIEENLESTEIQDLPVNEDIVESVSRSNGFERPPDIIVKQQTVEKVVTISKPLYNYTIQKIPKYAPIKFTSSDEILAHLQKKWNLDGAFE